MNDRERGRRFFLTYCAFMIFAYAILMPKTARPGFSIWGPGDFPIFFVAAHIIRNGNAHRLYDLSLQTQVQQAILLPYGWIFRGGLLPYNYPPFFAIVFVPLSFLPLAWAFHIWNIVNILLVLASVKLLLRHQQEGSSRGFVTASLVTFSFFPVFQGLVEGQTSFLIFFTLTLAYLALKSNWDYVAGAILALGLAKPQLVVVIAAMLLYRQRWRAVLAFGVTSILLLFGSWLMVGYDGMMSYIDLIRQMSTWDGVYGIYPALMPNLRGTVYRFEQLYHAWPGTELSPVILGAATLLLSAFVLVLVLQTWKAPWNPASPEFDLRFAQTVIGSLLLSPHLYDHDLVLLVLVGFLLVNYFADCTESVQVHAMIAVGHAIPLVTVLTMGIVATKAQVVTFLLIILMIVLWNEVRCNSRCDWRTQDCAQVEGDYQNEKRASEQSSVHDSLCLATHQFPSVDT